MKAVVSVAMATFNGEEHIVEQIESLARQTVSPCELVVTDDGSTDGTLKLVEDCARHLQFPVRLVRNGSRLGYGRNFLKAALLADSEYVAFCDQDDIWHKDKIRIVNEVASQGKYDLIVHGGKVVDAKLRELGESFPHVEDGVIELDRLSRLFVPGYAMVVRKSILILNGAEGIVDVDNVSFEHDLWICDWILRGGSCYGISERLVSYRQHDTNVLGFSYLANSERHSTRRKD